MWPWQHLLYKHSHSPRGPGQAGKIAMRTAGVSPCTEKTKEQARDVSGVPAFWAVPGVLAGLAPGARCSLWKRQTQHKVHVKPTLLFSLQVLQVAPDSLCAWSLGIQCSPGWIPLPFAEGPESDFDVAGRWLRKCHPLFPKPVTILSQEKAKRGPGQKWHWFFVASICVQPFLSP